MGGSGRPQGRRIIDADVGVLPAGPARLPASGAGDPIPRPEKLARLLGVELQSRRGGVLVVRIPAIVNTAIAPS
jgi:hypothetical protein